LQYVVPCVVPTVGMYVVLRYSEGSAVVSVRRIDLRRVDQASRGCATTRSFELDSLFFVQVPVIGVRTYDVLSHFAISVWQ